MLRMFRKSDEGFTLVELMVVVLIIGILVAIAIPVFNAASRSARQRTCQSNQRTIDGAVQQWLAAEPTNSVDADFTVTNGSILVPAYIKTPPLCPADKTEFYSVVATGTSGQGEVAGCPSGETEVHLHY